MQPIQPSSASTRFPGQHYLILTKDERKDLQSRGKGFEKCGLLVIYTGLVTRQGATQDPGMRRAIMGTPKGHRLEFCIPREYFEDSLKPILRSEIEKSYDPMHKIFAHDYSPKYIARVSYAINGNAIKMVNEYVFDGIGKELEWLAKDAIHDDAKKYGLMDINQYLKAMENRRTLAMQRSER